MKFSKLTIDGTEYTLAYDFNEICRAEELTGANLLLALESLGSLTAAQLRGLLLAALEAGPEPAFPDKGKMTRAAMERAGELIRLDTLQDITTALAEAYRLAIHQEEENTAAAPAGA